MSAASGSPSASASPRALTGPRTSVRPRTSSRAASSRVHDLRRRSGIDGVTDCGTTAFNSSKRSTEIQKPFASKARAAATSSSKSGRQPRDALYLAGEHALQNPHELRQVHRLLEAVADRLIDERVSGELARALDVVETRRGVREDRSEQLIGDHALDLRGEARAVAVPRYGKGKRRGPAPARLEDRRVDHRLNERFAHRLRIQVAEHVIEREGMRRPEREDQRLP